MTVKQYTLAVRNITTLDRDSVNITANSIEHALKIDAVKE